MLVALLLAASCAGWPAQAAGHYLGTVESDGPKAIDTWLEPTPTGLAGTYVLHEPTRDVSGTLEAAGEQGCGVAVFHWTDLYGTGTARLRFDLDAHCFEGNWGGAEPKPALTWRSCAESKVTS